MVKSKTGKEMKIKALMLIACLQVAGIAMNVPGQAQIGRRFPSERKVVRDPVTGTELVFLTSTPAGDRKIYPTHNQWTSDGQWLIFRSNRVRGEAMAVHEKTGEMVQVTEGGYRGRLNVARKSMKLYHMRRPAGSAPRGSLELVEVDLVALFANSEAGKVRPASFYQRVCGKTPGEIRASADMALDADEQWVWFRVGREEAAKHLPEGTRIEPAFGPRNMGAGPSGIAGMNVQTGEIRYVVSVPFQIGHIQSNPWVPGEIVFCWETGGKSPQRTWIVRSDGTGLRPLYPESEYEWVTHEAVITPDEVAFAIMGHRKITAPLAEDPASKQPASEHRVSGRPLAEVPETGDTGDTAAEDRPGVRESDPGQDAGWGPSGTREKPTGLGVVNIRTREMMIWGQIPYGSGFWHVTGSPDGRFLAGDNFSREIYLIDRNTQEIILLSAGHKRTAADHPHPTFSPDGTRIQIQSAMLSEDGRSMNICIIAVPEERLQRNREIPEGE